MKLFDFIRKLFGNFRSSFQGRETRQWLVVDHQDIIDPEQFYHAAQIITPRIYEFTEEENLSALRLHDYVYLPQLKSEQIAQQKG